MGYITGVIKKGRLASLRFGGNLAEMRQVAHEFGGKEGEGYITLPPDILLYDKLLSLSPNTYPHEAVREWAEEQYLLESTLRDDHVLDFINTWGAVLINGPSAHEIVRSHLIDSRTIILCDLFRLGFWRSAGFNPVAFEHLPSEMGLSRVAGLPVVVDGLPGIFGASISDLVFNVAGRGRDRFFCCNVEPRERADLFYPMLNAIDPFRFHNRREFINRFCEYERKWHGYAALKSRGDRMNDLHRILNLYGPNQVIQPHEYEIVPVELEEKHQAIVNNLVKPDSPKRFRTLATICPESLGYERFEPLTMPILSIADKILTSSRKVLITCEENFYRRRLAQVLQSIAHPTERRKVVSVMVDGSSPETYIDYHISASQDDDIVITDVGCSVWFRREGRDEIRLEPLKITHLNGKIFELKIQDPKGGETDEARLCQTGENFQRAN